MNPARSRKIGRDKLAKLTGDDHETIKFLEGTQQDAAGAVDEANAASIAAAAAQAAAEQAADDAAAAATAAAAAQITANGALASAGAAQTTANTALANAATAQSAANAAQTTANAAQTLANTINADYISKTAAPPQSVARTLQAASYLLGGLQVVGPRITGWTAATGTPYYGAFNGNTTYAAGATYLQAEAAAVASGLLEARQRIIALEKAMRDHGLIN